MNQTNSPDQPLDALQKIKQAEEKARKKIAEAQEQEAVKIVQAAQEKSETIKQGYIAEAKKKAEKEKLAILQKAEAEAGTIETDTEKLIASLRDKAKPKMSEAVELVIKEIEKHVRSKKA